MRIGRDFVQFLDEDASGLTTSVKADTTDLGTIVLKRAALSASPRGD